MQKQISKLASGIFEDLSAAIVSDADRIELFVTEDSVKEGVLRLDSTDGHTFRGVAYSSNTRFTVLQPAFEGVFAEISYRFDATGLKDGDEEHGTLSILCLGMELSIPFTAQVERLHWGFEQGEVRTLSDFFRLASQNFREAFRLFQNPQFPKLFDRSNKKERLYYEGLTKYRVSIAEFEEFLVACGQKSRMTFSLARGDGYYEDVRETRKECILLQKDGWGYIDIHVSCDADFVLIEKKEIREEDFIGGRMELPVYIHGALLHPGKNYAEITFSTAFDKQTFRICAIKGFLTEEPLARASLKKQKAALTELYIKYRLEQMITGIWAEESLKILDELLARSEDRRWYLLFKTHVLLENNEREAAVETLAEFNASYSVKTVGIKAYTDYLDTLIQHDEAYTAEKRKEIERLFLRYNNNFPVFWIQLFFSEDYLFHKAKKLSDIRSFLKRSGSSAVLYAEAACMYLEEPQMLCSLDDFEMHVLLWAGRHSAISKDMALQIAKLVLTGRANHPFLYRILAQIGELYPERDVISAICTYLIRNAKSGENYAKWYAKGIEAGLRVTLLYEYYMMSVSEVNETTCPKSMQLYFAYHCELPNKAAAKLFSFIISNKEKEPAMYRGYRKYIDEFSKRMLQSGEIFPELVPVYEDFLEQNELTKEMADAMSRLFFSREFRLNQNLTMSRFHVLDEALETDQTGYFSDGEVILPQCTYTAAYLMEDQYGNRFAAEGYVEKKPLFSVSRFSHLLLEHSPENPYYLADFTDRKGMENLVTHEDMEKVHALLVNDNIRKEYKESLLPAVFAYLNRHPSEEFLEDFLSRMDLNMLTAEEKAQVTELYVEKGFQDKAYRMITAYSVRKMVPESRLHLCTEKIREQNGIADDRLIQMAFELFKEGHFNSDTINYLVENYRGGTDELVEIRKAAISADLPDTAALEERILTQMLFTNHFTENKDEIFLSYASKNPIGLVSQAYFAHSAYEYMMKEDMIPNSEIFEGICELYQAKQYVSEICQLALLKYLTLNGTSDVSQSLTKQELVHRFAGQGMYFAFFEKLDHDLLIRHDLHDKIFFEYHGKSTDTVFLRYYYGSESGREERQRNFTEMPYGIYAIYLPLFFGDSLTYSIIVRDENGVEKVAEKSTRERSNVYYQNGGNRFDLINNMIAAVALHEDNAATAYLEEFSDRDYMVGKIFTLL